MTTSIYRYRWLLYELVLRDLVLRYRGSALGFFWTLLNPLLFLAVYTLVFSVYLRVPIEHFAVFLIAGLIPWQWFASSIGIGTTAIVDGRAYVGKAVFAPEILLLVPVFSNLINFLLSLPILIGIALAFGVHIGWPVLVLPVLVGIQFLFTFSLLLIVSTYNVFFRDLQQIVAIVITLAFYLVPIAYPMTTIPEAFRPYVLANPMADLILAFQSIFYYDTLPSWKLVGYALGFSCVLFAAGREIFSRYKDSFADFF